MANDRERGASRIDGAHSGVMGWVWGRGPKASARVLLPRRWRIDSKHSFLYDFISISFLFHFSVFDFVRNIWDVRTSAPFQAQIFAKIAVFSQSFWFSLSNTCHIWSTFPILVELLPTFSQRLAKYLIPVCHSLTSASLHKATLFSSISDIVQRSCFLTFWYF